MMSVVPRPPKISLSSFQTTASKKYGNMSSEFLILYPALNDSEAGRISGKCFKIKPTISDSAKNDAIRDNMRTSNFLWSQQWLKHAKKALFTYFWDHTPPGQQCQKSKIIDYFLFKHIYKFQPPAHRTAPKCHIFSAICTQQILRGPNRIIKLPT